MSYFKSNFEDIRMLISIQGYNLNNQYVIREIGVWSRKFSGHIPFNCKINMKLLDNLSIRNIQMAESLVHGIRLKKQIEHGIPSSEATTTLKVLYNLTKRDDYDSDYIGVLKSENVSWILCKADLGRYMIEIEDLDILNTPEKINLDILIKNEKKNHLFCDLHQMLRNNETPLCSHVKVNILANELIRLSAQQQQSTNGNTQITNTKSTTSSIYDNKFSSSFGYDNE